MRSIVEIIRNIHVTKKNLRTLSRDNKRVIFAWNHIGDLCIAFSCLSKYDDENIKIVISNKFREFENYYKRSNREFCFLDEHIINSIMYCARFSLSRFLFKKYSNFLITDPWYYFPEIISKKKSFTLIDFYRECLFEYDGEMLFPNIKSDSQISLDKQSIILSPYAGSMENISEQVWNSVVSECLEKGYSVYCNVTSQQTPLQNTIPLQCTIADLALCCKQAKLFIGLRSGIMDFIVSTEIPIIAIYNGKYDNMYSLKAWKKSSKCYEYNYKNEKDIIIQINKALSELEIS